LIHDPERVVSIFGISILKQEILLLSIQLCELYDLYGHKTLKCIVLIGEVAVYVLYMYKGIGCCTEELLSV